MSDDAERPDAPDSENADAGEPISELAGMEHPISGAFLTVVRKKIQRRTTASQLAAFSWNVPRIVFLELWNALIETLGPRDTQKGGRA